MKRIRSIQFKVFICLFISFMVVFGYVIKNKYDQQFNELVYNNQNSTADDYIDYCTSIANHNGEYSRFDLDQIKQGLSELPKSDETKICLLDTKGNLIEQYGFNKNDRLLIVNNSFSEVDDSDNFYDAYYYIDLTSLSTKQFKLLKDTIKEIDKKNYEDIDLCFEGQISEL